jgi:hypothetical protein
MEILNQLSIPSGTTAQRPITPEGISLWYNTSLTQVEYYNGSTWAAAGSGTGGGGGGSGMSTLFTDAFNNGLLDAANFGVTTNGTVSVVETTELNITNSGASGSYAFVWYKTKIPTPLVRRYTMTVKITAGGGRISFIKSQTAMFPISSATNNKSKLNVWLGTYGIYSDYHDGVDNIPYFSYNPVLTVGHIYDVTVDFTTTQFKVTISEPGLFASPLSASSLVNLNMILPDPVADAANDWWVVFGQPTNDISSSATVLTLTNFKVEG